MEGNPVGLEELEVAVESEEGTAVVDVAEAPLAEEDAPEILAELVVEEVSIDGMCGVY
ncbi:MAG: mycofactocin precursor MftA [Chloroflexaceae bacterium]